MNSRNAIYDTAYRVDVIHNCIRCNLNDREFLDEKIFFLIIVPIIDVIHMTKIRLLTYSIPF